MTPRQALLINAAKADDTQDLLNHIAWTDVVKPALEKHADQYKKLLVNEALGGSLPPNLTRERCAGICYGIEFLTNLMEQILQRGQKALADLEAQGLHIQK